MYATSRCVSVAALLSDHGCFVSPLGCCVSAASISPMFDAKPMQLDLVIEAPQELDGLVMPPTAAITGAIKPLASSAR